MCNKITVLTLLYVTIFVAVVKSEDAASERVVDFMSKDMSVGRTFGHNALKRLSFIFLPVMFTLGVISTLLMALAVISVKNLAIGVILLIVAISQAVSRLFFAASAPSPLVHLHPRAELLPAPVAAPWPAPGPLLSPWARSDNDATISD
ncbi:protein apnoia [Ostrinia nubilalis]|uniref:protein apnoia n=1 Tax=Ostrinia nubilalis TaxID=29057 RepID=UPI0030824020